jgi:hypothetical protein
MIIVASPSKPFGYSAKMTPRRQAILSAYEAEINALYEAVAETSQVDIPAPKQWGPAETLAFVRQTVASVLKLSIADDAKFFDHGCDR